MKESGRKRRRLLAAALIIALLLLSVGGYLFWKRTSPKTPPAATSLNQVREAFKKGLNPDQAMALARSLPETPENADAAFLLFEYAAESGNAEAALAVGRFYDPASEGPSGSIRKNPASAYEWYKKAQAGGQKQAEKRLADLRQWAEQKAAEGSLEAKELLANWR
ncbi:MAG: sel1 repeat family protein [Deltaproteobacteria bacterium]|nr:sel1 repeat family protein [Deltaproteobacteria bacterium]